MAAMDGSIMKRQHSSSLLFLIILASILPVSGAVYVDTTMDDILANILTTYH